MTNPSSNGQQQERRTEIVESAIRAFARKGFGGTTLADIAVEAGVSQPRISQVFGSKENAFIAAHQRASAEVLALLAANAEPPYAMAKLGHGYRELMERRPEVLLTIFQALTSSYVPVIADDCRRVITEIVEIVERAGGTPEDAVAFLERGFFIHAMLAAGVLASEPGSPAVGRMLDASRLR